MASAPASPAEPRGGASRLGSLLASCQTPADFGALAEVLLTRCHLVVEPASKRIRRYVLSDIEFYHCHPRDHADPFAHAHPSQSASGTWYFHAAGGGSGFKEGSYKGLDVTFGNSHSRSGILIRRIVQVEGIAASRSEDQESNYSVVAAIDGPSLVCDAILGTLGFDKVRDLVAWLRKHPSGCDLDALSGANPLRLELVSPASVLSSTSAAGAVRTQSTKISPSLELGRVWACPRHGLSLKKAKAGSSHADELRRRLDYIARPYRFLSARPKNGAINLAYAALLERISLSSDNATSATGSSERTSAAPSSSSDSVLPFSKHTSAIVEALYPPLTSQTDQAAWSRAHRTVSNYLSFIQAGYTSRQPTSFAGSGLAATREVGGLYGSLMRGKDYETILGSSRSTKEQGMVSTSSTSTKRQGVKRRRQQE